MSGTARHIALLVQASEALTSCRDTDEIMRLLVRSALELVGGEAGTWGVHHGDTMTFTEYFRGGRWEPIDCVFTRGGPGVPGWVMVHRRGYISNDTSVDPVPRRDLVEALGFRDLIDVPLLNKQDELLGAFELHNKTGGGGWTEADHELLRGLASIAVAALENERARRRAEDEAAARLGAHAILEAAIEGSPAAIMLLDFDGTVRLWNSAAVAMFGWTRDEMIGRLYPAMESEDRDEFLANLGRVARGGRITGEEIVRHRKGGEPFHAQLFGSPVHGPDGISQCLAVMVDITRAKREALRQEFLGDASAVLASSLDIDDILHRLVALAVPRLADWAVIHRVGDRGWLEPVALAHADPAAAPLAARLRRPLAPMPEAGYGLSYVMSQSRGQLVQAVDDALLQRVARDADHLDAIRAMRTLSFVSAPLLVAGRPLGAFTLHSATRRYDERDLSMVEELAARAGAVLEHARLYQQTRSLLHRLERLQAVTVELSATQTAADVARTIVDNGKRAVDATACALWAERDDGALYLVDSAGVPEAHLEDWRVLAPGSGAPGLEVVETGVPQWIETEDDWRTQAPVAYERVRRTRPLSSYAAIPIGVRPGHRALLTFSFPYGHRFAPDEKDYILTLARQCQQALDRAELFAKEANARAHAEAASRAKDEFLAMLGHELRNPLAPMKTALQLLEMRGIGAGTKELPILERQVDHLVRLVDDLLDVSRITRGKVELDKARLELAQVIASAIEIASPLFERRRHALTVDVPAGLQLEGDRTRLTQIFANLLTNASKYTPERGTIAVRAWRDGDELVVSVRDNGAGIDAVLLPRIFELFTQGPRPIDRSEGGLGIGLTLVKSLTALHGGRVEARSDGPGHGSEFVVRLPAATEAPVAEPAGSTLAPPPPTARRILVIDDNRDAADMLAQLLASVGHEVEVAYDGPHALRVAESFAPQIAIVDIGLPVMDGYELAARLRELPFAGQLRLFALTGYGQVHDRARSQAAGFAAHFVKPISADLLYRHLGD